MPRPAQHGQRPRRRRAGPGRRRRRRGGRPRPGRLPRRRAPQRAGRHRRRRGLRRRQQGDQPARRRRLAGRLPAGGVDRRRPAQGRRRRPAGRRGRPPAGRGGPAGPRSGADRRLAGATRPDRSPWSTVPSGDDDADGRDWCDGRGDDGARSSRPPPAWRAPATRCCWPPPPRPWTSSATTRTAAGPSPTRSARWADPGDHEHPRAPGPRPPARAAARRRARTRTSGRRLPRPGLARRADDQLPTWCSARPGCCWPSGWSWSSPPPRSRRRWPTSRPGRPASSRSIWAAGRPGRACSSRCGCPIGFLRRWSPIALLGGRRPAAARAGPRASACELNGARPVVQPGVRQPPALGGGQAGLRAVGRARPGAARALPDHEVAAGAGAAGLRRPVPAAASPSRTSARWSASGWCSSGCCGPAGCRCGTSAGSLVVGAGADRPDGRGRALPDGPDHRRSSTRSPTPPTAASRPSAACTRWPPAGSGASGWATAR